MSRLTRITSHATRRRGATGSDYAATIHAKWAGEAAWGIWDIPEEELRLLPVVEGRDALDIGCGAAYVCAWMARRGARVTGIDPTASQLQLALQAQVKRFVTYYNEVRPHRAKGRKTPKSAFDSRAKARPMRREGSYTRELRIRHDRVDSHGNVTIRYQSKLHHIGMGRALKGTRIILLVAGRHIRIIDQAGELLREFDLDPSRNYQPRGLG